MNNQNPIIESKQELCILEQQIWANGSLTGLPIGKRQCGMLRCLRSNHKLGQFHRHRLVEHQVARSLTAHSRVWVEVWSLYHVRKVAWLDTLTKIRSMSALEQTAGRPDIYANSCEFHLMQLILILIHGWIMVNHFFWESFWCDDSLDKLFAKMLAVMAYKSYRFMVFVGGMEKPSKTFRFYLQVQVGLEVECRTQRLGLYYILWS